MEGERSAKSKKWVEAVGQAGRQEGRKGRERKVVDSSRYINRSPTSWKARLGKDV